MKNLKIRFGLFSLLAILAVSVSMTSCEQENIAQEPLEEVAAETSMIFTLPNEINDLSDEEIAEYLQSLSDEEIAGLSMEIGNGELESRCWWRTIYRQCKVSGWGCQYYKREYLHQVCGNKYRRIWGSCCLY